MIQKQNDQRNVLNQQKPQTILNQSQQVHEKDHKNNNSRINIFLILLLTIISFFISFRTFFEFDFGQTEIQSDLEQSSGFNSTTVHSESQLEQIIQRMSTRPPQKQGQKNIKKLKPTKQAYFAFRLHQSPNNPNYIEAQSYYFNKKYQTQQYSAKQLPLCIVSSGRNVVYQNRYERYINSLARQQYDNFKVVIIDDYSSDGSVEAIKKYLQLNQMTQLRMRTTLISNQKRQYALYNRDLAIMQHCSSDSIIVELDTDDEFIGRKVLKTINAVYSKEPEVWAMYSSYIYWSPTAGQPTQGISAKIPTKILQQGTYRLTTEWFTSATRTFRRKLYQRINKDDFKDEEGNFYKWTSDLFVHYSLIEMAGLQHYKYIHEIFYYYYLDHNSFAAQQKAISRLDALSIKRYKLLKSLEQQAERIQDRENQDWLKEQKQRLIDKLKRENN